MFKNRLKGEQLFSIFIILVGLFSVWMRFSPSSRKFVLDRFSNDSVKVKNIVIKDTVFIENQAITKNDTLKLLKCEDNIYRISASVNGCNMLFLLDSGCSNMSISMLDYAFLKKHHFVSDDVIDSEGYALIANGDTTKVYNIILDSVTICNKTLKNVECQVFSETYAPSLLGQSVIEKLGNAMISYKDNSLIIEN